MPKLTPATQQARRARILDAAELCFARSGFHRCTMQDICKEAGISPGALYVYFSSKEDLIAGIVERDRTKLAAKLAELSDAPDLLSALSKLGEHYAIEEPPHKRVLNIEIGCEATRNPAVGETFYSVDEFCRQNFERIFERAEQDGKIAPAHDARTLAEVVSLLGDGLFWRRAVDPAFDAQKLLPVLVGLVSALLNPVENRAASAAGTASPAPKAPAPKAKVKSEAAQ
ncbi:MAG: TetR/AcrR family transcriptional regulator [Hyphomicrobium sp.]|jgi:TetR/AcrR family transcriptional repressor of uid operon|uniref:TetR/AcrR family transcriptional regulator n=1 Tax=Hyphomicrobium sp. TaxID=82 RepID=UPI0025BBFA7B|nr:TetR/AcrR family transcriptional regulator [Hyphomicrobium sp.]MBX9863405.1 TetR/AcrR family transcriptional regulator [Hyphomicrobium sp.]